MQISTDDRPNAAKAIQAHLALLAILICLSVAAPAPPAVAQDAATGQAATGQAATEPAADEPVGALRASPAPLPVAHADSYSVAQDKTRTVTKPGVLGNDSKRRPLTARFVLGVEYGELKLNPSGGFSYTPDANFRGVDYFKYRACEKAHPSRCSKAVVVKLTVSGSAPVASADAYDAKKNHKKVIPSPGLLRNDTDANGDPLRVISYSQPTRGGAIVGSGGYVRFVPDRNYTGNTSFRYWIGDGTGLRDSAIVTFRVRK